MHVNQFVAGMIFTVVVEVSIVFIYVFSILLWRTIRKIVFKGDEK